MMSNALISSTPIEKDILIFLTEADFSFVANA